MSSRTTGVIVGIVLIAIAVAWFVTPLSSIVLDQVQVYQPQSLRGPASLRTNNWDMVKTILDVANLLIGGVGIFLTLRSGRSKSPASQQQ